MHFTLVELQLKSKFQQAKRNLTDWSDSQYKPSTVTKPSGNRAVQKRIASTIKEMAAREGAE
jgi:hypothetical protein